MTFRLPSLFPLLAIVVSSVSHAADDDEILTKTGLQDKSKGAGETLFERIPFTQSGVNVRYELDTAHPLRRLYAYGWATGNVAIGDLDGDNRADLFFPGTIGRHRLFVQKDDFQFKEVTETAQLAGDRGWGSCAVLGDVDNDGDLDVYVVNYDSPNQLLMNISRGGVVRFVDMAVDYGVALSTGALSASFVDFDNDRHLDLYLQTFHREPEGGRPDSIETKVQGDAVLLPEKWRDSYLGYLDSEKEPQWVEAPLADRVFRNRGEGKFFPEPRANLGDRRSFTVAHTWLDFDHNLKPDLYVANDSHMPDLLFRIDNQHKFMGISTRSLPYTPWFARGGVAADFDNDLLIDFLATGSAPLTHENRLAYGEPFRQDVYRVSNSGGAMQVTRNALFDNTGTSRFRELAQLAGVASTGATWAVKGGDYDGDGNVDLFFATGEARDWTSLASGELTGESLRGKTRWDILASQPERREKDLAFRNGGDWQFEEVGEEWGLDFRGMSYSAGQGDLDGDGDLDLVVCPLGEEVILYRNQSDANRIVVQLEGIQTNPTGVGAELLVEVGEKTFLQQLYPTGGFKNSDEPAFFVGMGAAEKIDTLTVRWPGSGAMTTLKDLEAGYRYSILEAFSLTPQVQRSRTARPLFAGSKVLAGTGHGESEFNDYLVQPLLPPGVSRTGSTLAATDLDQDGAAELLIGGSSGVPTQLIARSSALANVAAQIVKAKDRVDGAAVFFDANNDDNPDLFLASSSVEMGENEELAKDRLYLGGSKGFLPVNEEAIPGSEANSGTAAAVDYDRDGDVDLFVGARFEVGDYPKPGISRLLRNDGTGNFQNATLESAPGLESVGPISSAIWSDADNDGWLDLFVATQWGPIHFWKNEEGILKNQTAESGLGEYLGLWNAITGGDIDNDGDIDYLVANEGLNSGLRASAEFPAQLFRSDFLGTGTPQLIETVRESGRLFPKVGWLDLAELKPDLLKEYKSSRDFTENGLPKLFSAEIFAQADSRSANTLESGYLLNDGKGHFTFHALPRIAQASTSYGIVLTDVNADGFCDAYLVQNRASATVRRPDPENAGVSQLLLNSGKEENRFTPVDPDASGLVLSGAARSLIATDLNNDDRADFIVTLRNGDPAVFLNQSETTLTRPLKVNLDTRGKHPAGARVTVAMEGFPAQTAEYYAGGGYLSQSPPELFFASPNRPEGSAAVTIRWADGSTTNRKIYFQ